jgi:DNA polymerase III subunit gamma/tau
MTYQALARKYRPQSFDDVIGQPTLVRTLQNAIEQNRIHHAYLFSGVRGVGKTTTARIFAKALNCMNGPALEPCNDCSACREITEGIDMDVREIDAATYTQVDNIRELREVTQFQPARDRNRIFIIDEAHMLSAGAWNALLKLIEEPPPHVIFMMATTEMQKVPATILSRVQQFMLRKVTADEVAERLAVICTKEGITADREALLLLARRGEGSVRDSLSILDQIVAFSGKNITAADVISILGVGDTKMFVHISEKIDEGDSAALLEILDEAAEAGRDFKLLYRDYLSFLRNLLLISSGARPELVSLAGDDFEEAARVATRFRHSELLRVMTLLMDNDELISRTEQQRLAVEIALLKAATLPSLRSIEGVLAGSSQESRPSAARIAAPPASSRAAAVRPSEAVAEERDDAAPAAAPAASSAADGSLRSKLLEAIRPVRRFLATHIEGARSIREEGNELLLEYAAGQDNAVEYINDGDQLAFVGKTASDILGRTMKAKIVRSEAAKKAAAKTEARPPAPGDDPILKAFQKHLGAEVVPPRAKRSTEGS